MEKESIINDHYVFPLDGHDDRNVSGIGTLKNDEGYQRVKISSDMFLSALKYFEKYPQKEIVISVKTDCPVMIGKKNIGLLIAPIVDRE